MTLMFAEKMTPFLHSSTPSLWESVLAAAFSEKKVTRETLQELIANTKITSSENILSTTRKVLAISLYYQNHSLESHFLAQDLSELYFSLVSNKKLDPLSELYHSLLSFLIFGQKREPRLFSQQYGFFLADQETPDPLKNAEAALIFFLLGFYLSDQSYFKKGCEIAQNQTLFFDQNGEFFSLFLEKETQACFSTTCFVNALTFWIYRLFNPDLIEEKKLLKQLSDKEFKKIHETSPLFLLLYLELRRITLHSLPSLEEMTSHITLAQLGAEIYQREDFRLALCCSGKGTGVGSCRKKSIEIVCFGPQVNSIEENRFFGVYRAPFLKNSTFKEIKFEKNENFFIFDGWTRLIDAESSELKPGKTWLHVHAITEKNVLDLDLKWINFSQTPKVFFLFFVKASKLIVDKSIHLQPHTLDRYEGLSAPVSFVKDQDTLSIQPLFQGKMQAIPLSGEGHFWGADFLLSYELPKDSSLTFKIF